jgi:hypothetical protein
MNPTPLLIIVGTIVALLAIQRLLARTQPAENKHAPPNAVFPDTTSHNAIPDSTVTTAAPRPRGRKLTEGLSVTGLDERGLNSLKALIRAKDISGITTFLAFNHPGFVEIDDWFFQQRRRGENATGISMTDSLSQSLLEVLSNSERKLVMEFNPKAVHQISRDLMSRFGGHAFSSYFGHYSARQHSVTQHVPPFDPDRKILEDLAKAGVARKGRHIPLAARLTVLKMSQLRQMAKDLKLDKKFTRKQDAAESLASVPGAAVLLSMQYVIDDLFMLLPIKEDVVLIKHEWSYLEAYAKMLSSLKL